MNQTSIVILTYNNLNYTKDCIESIQNYTKKDSYEIIIVDNNSTDGTKEWLKTQTHLKVLLNEENMGFPKGCNQGISLASTKNDILLLNNDTIVTTNWLDNLKCCLYSNPSIGAVGSVSNHTENLQGVDFTYDNFEEMQVLAKKNNVSNSARWEEKLFLIGFCLLIKREVLQKIGELDETYTPGYVEDNDLSLRIMEAGYKLMLCHDSFIHHYLGTEFRKDLSKFYPILYKNRAYFEHKWGFSTFCFDEIKHASLRILKDDSKKKLAFLEYHCEIGATMLKLKYDYKNSIVDGIEEEDSMRKIASKIGNVVKNYNDLKENKYDYILIGNALETVPQPDLFLTEIGHYLKPDGFIIGEIHNCSSHNILLPLLEDHSYKTGYERSNQRNHFTISDVKQLFTSCGYLHYGTLNWFSNLTNDEEGFLKKLETIISSEQVAAYRTHYYSFQFQKSSH